MRWPCCRMKMTMMSKTKRRRPPPRSPWRWTLAVCSVPLTEPNMRNDFQNEMFFKPKFQERFKMVNMQFSLLALKSGSFTKGSPFSLRCWLPGQPVLERDRHVQGGVGHRFPATNCQHRVMMRIHVNYICISHDFLWFPMIHAAMDAHFHPFPCSISFVFQSWGRRSFSTGRVRPSGAKCGSGGRTGATVRGLMLFWVHFDEHPWHVMVSLAFENLFFFNFLF